MFFIAEMGCNWIDGGLEKAKRMIKAAKDAGCDAAKFQMYQAYHIEQHPKSELLKRGILTKATMKELVDYGNSIDMTVFATPFYPEAVDILHELGVELFKIRHTDIKSKELIDKVKALKKATIISVDVKALDFVLDVGDFKILYCVGKYPAKREDIDLGVIMQFGLDGYSNHCPDPAILMDAVKAGAEIIETHVMLDGDDGCLEKGWSIPLSKVKEFLADGGGQEEGLNVARDKP